MVRVNTAVVAALALCSSVSAGPIAQREFEAFDVSAGYDEAIKGMFEKEFGPTVEPEHITLKEEDLLATATSSNETKAYVPADAETTNEKRYIIGKDDRVPWHIRRVFPGRSVGRVMYSNGLYCTGTLVGPNLVLTAKHCLEYGPGAVFSAGDDRRDNGHKHFGTANITATMAVELSWHKDTPCERANDWAVLRLDRDLGTELGYFGVTMPNPDLFDRAIFTHQGYPSDRDSGQRPYRHTWTTIHSAEAGACGDGMSFRSNTDTHYGQGGGPIWRTGGIDGDYSIWGVLSFSNQTGNWKYAGWASGGEMVRGVQRALDLWTN